MGNSFQILDIVIFAAVAGFLLFRLRSVLGRRTGNERRRPDPFASRPAAPPRPQIVQPPVQPNGAPPNAGRPNPFAPALPPSRATPWSAPPVDALAALQAADPSFNATAFLSGARGAFEIIVKAFAAGDLDALRPLLSPDVFAAFSEAVRARLAAKETHQTQLLAIKAASIEHSTIEGGTALLTVKLISDQINVTRDAQGKVVDGDPDKPVETIDFWTFSRPLRSRDPNWILVATHS